MKNSITKTRAEFLQSAAALEKTGDFDLALNLYREAISIWPSDANLYYAMGRAMCKSHSFLSRNMALGLYHRAIALDPHHLKAHLALAAELGKEQDTLFDAIEENRHALAVFGQQDGLLIQKAHFLDRCGDTKGAIAIVKMLTSKDTQQSGNAARVYAEIADTREDQENAIKHLERRLTAPLSSSEKKATYFALGRLQDRMGLYESAFRNIETANNLIDEKYDNDLIRKNVKRIADFFSKERMDSLPKAAQNFKKPVFIVGLPRSGSTLIEQILSAHPDVLAGGETIYISVVQQSLQSLFGTGARFPDFLSSLSRDQLTQAATEQLARMSQNDKHVRRITDKNLNNYLRIGLLNMLFPRAPIIHARRHPLDNCLSCYFSYFPGTPYIYRQQDLAQNYRNYQFLMGHWRTVSTIPILDVRYEDVILTPRETIAKILDFCGLPWDDACLDFHKSNRLTATASYRQVRKPLYTESIGRWRNYESHLGPLISSLGESCREYETPNR